MTFGSAAEQSSQVCITCGCVWWMPTIMLNQRRQDKKSFYCPSGHSQCFSESESDVLRRERDRLKQNEARLIEEARELRAVAEKAQAATKRLKRRVAAGVCPCCHRTVGQMAAHMAAKHPNYVADNVVKLKAS